MSRKVKHVQVSGTCGLPPFISTPRGEPLGPQLMASHNGKAFFINPEKGKSKIYILIRDGERNRFIRKRRVCAPSAAAPVLAIGGRPGYRGQRRYRFVTVRPEWDGEQNVSTCWEFDAETASFSKRTDTPIATLKAFRQVFVVMAGKEPRICVEKDPEPTAFMRDVNRKFATLRRRRRSR